MVGWVIEFLILKLITVTTAWNTGEAGNINHADIGINTEDNNYLFSSFPHAEFEPGSQQDCSL